ncbi:MAG: hydrogenase maturation nickel metallochaperone HypA [Chloroflexota bacterium]|nr:hydrogenase maturation nickel metallochaperone HypA [Chloroflexota bacterium]
MHEMALAEGILAVALDVSEQRRVHRIRVRVGELQRVVPDALHFSFELLTPDTAAEGAVLELQDVPARVNCRRCGADTQPREAALACATCGAVEIDVVDGGDVSVEAVQLEDGWRFRPSSEAPSESMSEETLSPDFAPPRWRGSESALDPPWDTKRRLRDGLAVIQVPPEHLAWHALHDALEEDGGDDTPSSEGHDGQHAHSHGRPGTIPGRALQPAKSSTKASI